MKIKNKLVIGFLGVSLFVALLGAVVIYLSLDIGDKIDEIQNSNLVEIRASALIAHSIQRIESNIRETILEVHELVNLAERVHGPEPMASSSDRLRKIEPTLHEEIAHSENIISAGVKTIRTQFTRWERATAIGHTNGEFEAGRSGSTESDAMLKLKSFEKHTHEFILQ